MERIKNNLHIILPAWYMMLISSYLWQTLHNYYPADMERGVSGWMFYSEMLITNMLFIGGVFEDIIIFHPFGLMFGVLLAIYVFKIFIPEPDKNNNKKIVAIVTIELLLLLSAILLDKSSLYSFLIFSLPAIPGIWYSFRYINTKRFLLFFVSMLVFTFVWDLTSVWLMKYLYDDYARCWFYVIDGKHSLLYNPNSFILGEMPVAIDICYPGNGMMFLTGIVGYLYVRKKVC